jgi:hypothetical protein
VYLNINQKLKHMEKFMIILAVWTCLMKASCTPQHFEGPEGVTHLPNDVILEWNEVAYHAFGGEAYQHSLMASRINAMTHLAMHDALNAIFPVYGRYAYTGLATYANPVAAAANAAHTVLIHEIPEKKEYLDSALQQSLSAIPESESKVKGTNLGIAAGQAIINARAGDGSAGNPIVPVQPSTVSGVYQIVPPFDFVFAPYWVDVKPFGLQRNDQFRSLPHPNVNSKEYTEAFNEVKETGKLNSNLRTADQNEYTNFWYEFSETGWNRVTRIVALNKNLGLWETARLFALVNMAMADAYIAGWESKFHHNFWRPYTAIHNALLDGNDQTEEDRLWEPALPTPPVQDYPSTHSALGNAAAKVLASILGDNTSFTMSSPTALPGSKDRSFTSFGHAADENADSRVKAGIHFRFACEAGQEMGDSIGQYVVNNHLKPLK